MKHLSFLFRSASAIALGLICCQTATAQTLTVDLNKRGADVSPTMYGIFFEEINHAGDGGLYAEMLQNRGFEEHVLPTGMTYRDGKVYGPALPHYGKNAVEPWTADWNMEAKRMQGWRVEGGKAEVVLAEHPLHVNTPHALRLTGDGKATLVNEGYWGVAAKKGEKYDLRFYLKANSSGQVVAMLRNESGASAGEATLTTKGDGQWNEYTTTITATETFSKGAFALCFDGKDDVFVDYVSLFPQATFKNRKNGLRKDIAETLAALHPQFMRWPGGCIVEGACYENRVRWKETLGDPMTRRGEWDLWGYRSTYGLGYHEFLQFCEDLGMKGMFVANAAMSCSYRCGDYSEEQAEIDRCLQDMRDAIEYAIGDPAKNEWARRRAEAGHPAPFPLQYVEIGNENNGDIYKRHLNYMYAKLKAEYPGLTFINTLGGFPWEMDGTEGGDMVDPHWYVDPAFFFLHNNEFDSRQRGQWQVYVGEYACNNRVGSGNMMAALADASFILGMERNGDLVKMASYAPLLTNVNQPNWACNLIHFDTDRVMGRAAYYVQQLMAENRPTYNLGLNRVSGDTITIGPDAPACLQPEKSGDVVRCPLQFFAAGRDEQTGEVIIKVVNADTKPYRTKIQLSGAQTVNSLGKVITLRSQAAEDENTLDEPRRICPQTSVYRKFAKQFNYKFEPLSLTILRIKATTKPFQFESKGNPIITHLYTADPAVLVEGDTLWLFTGHDMKATKDVDPHKNGGYVMEDWQVFSTTDMRHWTQYPTPLRIDDFAWADSHQAYAGHVAKRNGKYYWYVSTNWCGIGVAVSDKITGPYKDALGHPMLTMKDCPDSQHNWACIDPAIFIDDDNTPYIVWGNRECYMAKLKDNMVELDGSVHRIPIADSHPFTEAPWLHKRNSKYYLTYASEWPEKIAYATADNIFGPYEPQTVISGTPLPSETTHPAIVEFRGQWLFFSHDGSLPDGGSYSRSVIAELLHYNADGTIQFIPASKEGVNQKSAKKTMIP